MIRKSRPQQSKTRAAASANRKPLPRPGGRFIELGLDPLPLARQKQLLAIIGRKANDPVAKEFLARANTAIDFYRAVDRHESSAPTESEVRAELKHLKKQIQRTRALLQNISGQAWGQLSIALRALYDPTQWVLRWNLAKSQPELQDQTPGEPPEALLASTPDAIIERAVTGLDSLVKGIDTVTEHLKASRGGIPTRNAPRFLGNELARLFRDLLHIEVTTHEDGAFGKVFLACYSEATGEPAGTDAEIDLRHYFRVAQASMEPPDK